MKLLLFLVLSCSTTLADGRNPDGKYLDATDTYRIMQIEGWPVRISHRLAADAHLEADTLAELRIELHRVHDRLPAAAVGKIQHVVIWLELDNRPLSCYHYDRDWLIAHHYNPDKVGGVEIGNARNFIRECRRRDVNVLVHELAHAYHQRVIGFDDPRIIAAYQAAKANGKYQHVLRDNGHTVVHYAMTDFKEYFAESTEAYFGTNDYYPFNRAELEQFDPRMAALVKELWGDADPSNDQ